MSMVQPVRSMWATLALLAGSILVGATAWSAPMDTITDLGTLSGTSQSVATGINNEGQVVGVSYNSADGSFGIPPGTGTEPPRFVETSPGAQSFLYSNGQMTTINPTGGLATSINDSGQVVGGLNFSINNAGQYVGINIDSNGNSQNQLMSDGTAKDLGVFIPYAINNASQIAGSSYGYSTGIEDAAIYQNVQVKDLFTQLFAAINSGLMQGQLDHIADSRAIAINQAGDIIIDTYQADNSTHSYLYNAASGKLIDLTALPGGANLIGAALNDKDQVVGGGYLYSGGTVQALASLLPAGSGWSNLVATGINDAGQIVGQGLIDGQEHAFLITPSDVETVPEPGTLALWAFASLALAARAVRRAPTAPPRSSGPVASRR